MTAKLLRLLAACLFALASAGALAQYPSRPIKLIVPIPPGGAPDIVARVVGQKLSEILAVPVVVDNRAGSNGNIAGDLVAKSPPDGYTLLLGQDSLVAINPHLYAKMPFDPLKDLVPVATLVANQFVLAVNPSLPVKNFQEFIEYARRTTPPLPYASGGNGSQHHLSMEILKQRAGIDMLHVPFKGGAPATMATVAGDTAAMFAGTSTSAQIKAGKLRALAVTGTQRSPEYPDLPTIGEFYPGYEVTIWLALFAPAGTPEPVLVPLARRGRKGAGGAGRQAEAQLGRRGRAFCDDARRIRRPHPARLRQVRQDRQDDRHQASTDPGIGCIHGEGPAHPRDRRIRPRARPVRRHRAGRGRRSHRVAPAGRGDVLPLFAAAANSTSPKYRSPRSSRWRRRTTRASLRCRCFRRACSVTRRSTSAATAASTGPSSLRASASACPNGRRPRRSIRADCWRTSTASISPRSTGIRPA